MSPILKTIATITLMFILREALILNPCAATYPVLPGLAFCIPHGLV